MENTIVDNFFSFNETNEEKEEKENKRKIENEIYEKKKEKIQKIEEEIRFQKVEILSCKNCMFSELITEHECQECGKDYSKLKCNFISSNVAWRDVEFYTSGEYTCQFWNRKK
jgi:hypothetical protein